jgi:hypothetical protein
VPPRGHCTREKHDVPAWVKKKVTCFSVLYRLRLCPGTRKKALCVSALQRAFVENKEPVALRGMPTPCFAVVTHCLGITSVHRLATVSKAFRLSCATAAVWAELYFGEREGLLFWRYVAHAAAAKINVRVIGIHHAYRVQMADVNYLFYLNWSHPMTLLAHASANAQAFILAKMRNVTLTDRFSMQLCQDCKTVGYVPPCHACDKQISCSTCGFWYDWFSLRVCFFMNSAVRPSTTALRTGIIVLRVSRHCGPGVDCARRRI